jgi:hypothetical protein
MNGERLSKKELAPRPADIDVVGFSNDIRLTGWQWIGIGFFTVSLILFGPSVWERIEKFDVETDYRMPYDLSADYWLYDRYSKLAATQYDTLLIGDSVIWGQYVTREQTLSHHLNTRAGKQRFANLGLDGAHPVALAGLVEHYAQGVRGKSVLLQCDPLWLTSERSDLQIEGDYPFNHPRLLPQFFVPIPARPKEEWSPRIGIEVEKRVPFSSWTNHLQQAYFERTDIPSWTLEHPYEDPLENIKLGLPPSDNTFHHEPISWTARGIKKQDYPWVDLETSLQWRYFRRTVDILEQRGNRVFVLVGPFNEHLLNPNSHSRYKKVKFAIESWLDDNKINHLAPPPLPSELYADASHPLAAGYAQLADQLYVNFRR